MPDPSSLFMDLGAGFGKSPVSLTPLLLLPVLVLWEAPEAEALSDNLCIVEAVVGSQILSANPRLSSPKIGFLIGSTW